MFALVAPASWPSDQPLPTREIVIEGFATADACNTELERWMRSEALKPSDPHWELFLQSCDRQTAEAAALIA